jgi:hypothetical protein
MPKQDAAKILTKAPTGAPEERRGHPMLSRMISGGPTPMDEITAALDAMTHAERLRAVRGLGGADLGNLYERAEECEAITMEHFVPPHHPEVTEVVHHGLNSLPAFRTFQKRFCRSTDRWGNRAIFGYNEGLTRPLVGPGFFVTHPTAGVEHWEPRGAVVIDYHLEPDGPLSSTWPPFKPNCDGLQHFVYHRTRDFMRRVSAHVSIGAAYKDEKRLNVHFVLCRQD